MYTRINIEQKDYLEHIYKNGVLIYPIEVQVNYKISKNDIAYLIRVGLINEYNENKTTNNVEQLIVTHELTSNGYVLIDALSVSTS